MKMKKRRHNDVNEVKLNKYIIAFFLLCVWYFLA